MQVFAGFLACCVPLLALAEYVPFPGKLAVHLLDVQAPNVIFVNFETWPGFPRSVQVILPDTAVPEDTPQADSCEREKAQEALDFTRGFLAYSENIYVQDMRMNTSADQPTGLFRYSHRQGQSEPGIKERGAGTFRQRSDGYFLVLAW